MKVKIYTGEVTDSTDEMELRDTIDAERIRFIDKQWDVLFVYLDNGEERSYGAPMVTLKFV